MSNYSKSKLVKPQAQITKEAQVRRHAKKAAAKLKPPVEPVRRKKKVTQRQADFVEGLRAGKSPRKAAIDAGYTPATAGTAPRDLLPRVQENFRLVMQKFISPDKIALTVAAGLNAQTTKFATFEGVITDQRDTVDYAERRAAAELAAKLAGYYIPTERVDTRQNSGDRLDEMLAALRAGPVERGIVNPGVDDDVPKESAE